MRRASLWKSRLGFLLLLSVLAVSLFLFSRPFLLWAAVLLAGLALILGLLLRQETRALRLELQVRPGSQVGRDLPLVLTVRRPFRWSSSLLQVELDVESLLTGTTERQVLQLHLSGKEDRFPLSLPARRCGEHAFRCTGAWAVDPLGLFRCRCEPFAEKRALIWPRPSDLEVELSLDSIGTPRSDSAMQDRPGSDPSEMFDIREYVPGDDIRAIHWKLSSKTDSLILRQASEPSCYQVALLPDLGLRQGGQPVSDDELNGAASFGMAIGEALLRQGASFCLILPDRHGLRLCDIQDRRALRRALPQWLSLRVPEEAGNALRSFLSEHLEQYFTRLLILSAGRYQGDPRPLEGQLNVTVVSAVEAGLAAHSSPAGACTLLELPARPGAGETFHITC